MNTIQLLRSKYLTHAQTLGDIEFQIHILMQKRDQVRAQMQSLDQITPDLVSLETQKAVFDAKAAQASQEQNYKTQLSGDAVSVARSVRPSTE